MQEIRNRMKKIIKDIWYNGFLVIDVKINQKIDKYGKTYYFVNYMIENGTWITVSRFYDMDDALEFYDDCFIQEEE